MGSALFALFVFPGFLFLAVMGLAIEFIDRFLYARFQNRQGPRWFQPFADFVKLLGKEDLVPAGAHRNMFRLMPLIALTAVIVSFLYIPVWGTQAPLAFQGDAIVVLYLLTLPTLTFFLGAWYSGSLYATIGAVRTLTQLFAYEVPLFMGILAPALLAQTWSVSGISAFYQAHPLLALVNLLGCAVSLIALQGKLERVPFDIPEAETEIVGGSFTEYSGRMLAFFRMAIDMEAVVTISLIAAVFLPWGMDIHPALGFGLYAVKVLAVLFLLALMRSVMARLRIEQMVIFCWKWVAPAAVVQLLINLVVLGVLA